MVDDILNPQAKKKSPLEIAKERHANRTEEEISAIRAKAKLRSKAIHAAEIYIKNFAEVQGVDLTTLKEAYKQRNWGEVRQEAAKLALRKREILNVSRVLLDELKGIKDIDVIQLSKALKEDNLSKNQTLSKTLNTEKQKLLSLSQLENPIEVARKFSFSEALAVNSAIEKTFARWTWDFETDTSLKFLKQKLQNEILFVERSKSKYSTWEISKEAYEKRLALIEKRLDMWTIREGIKAQIAEIKTSRSVVGKNLVSDFERLFKDDGTDIAEIKEKAAEIKKKGDAIIKTATAKTKPDSQIKSEFLDFLKKNKLSRASKILSGVDVKDGFLELDRNMQKELYKIVDVTQDERDQTWVHWIGNTRKGYIRTPNSFKINGALRDVGGGGQNKVLGDIKKADLTKCKDMYGNKLDADDIKTIEEMDRVINKNRLPFPVRVVRNLDLNAVNALFDVDFSKINGSDLAFKISSLQSKTIIPDPGYLSTSFNAKQNVFTNRKIQLHNVILHCKYTYKLCIFEKKITFLFLIYIIPT